MSRIIRYKSDSKKPTPQGTGWIAVGTGLSLSSLVISRLYGDKSHGMFFILFWKAFSMDINIKSNLDIVKMTK